MKFDETYDLVASGKKTQTTRVPVHRWYPWYKDYPLYGKTVLAESPDGRMCRIRLKDVFVTTLDWVIVKPESIKAEGFEEVSGFIDVWKRLHGQLDTAMPVCVIRFELVRA